MTECGERALMNLWQDWSAGSPPRRRILARILESNVHYGLATKILLASMNLWFSNHRAWHSPHAIGLPCLSVTRICFALMRKIVTLIGSMRICS